MLFWPTNILTPKNTPKDSISNIAPSLPTLTPTPNPIPPSYLIPKRLHAFQTFNNCGPASLSMALSYVGIVKTQQELGQILRPFQVAGGDNDDKSVTLLEVAREAENQGAVAYLRPNGDMEKIKLFISSDIPVVARTWLGVSDDIGHYRLIRGYTETHIIQDDSLQGSDLTFTYGDFQKMWQPFNNEYLVIVEESKKEIVEQILGEDLNEEIGWKRALKTTERELLNAPDNMHLIFAMSRINHKLGNYDKSVEYFNIIENKLPFRTLWYQIEPIEAIYETGDYERLFSVTERVLNYYNRAFSELYYLRGKAYKNQGKIEKAKDQFEKAAFYNINNKEFRIALGNSE